MRWLDHWLARLEGAAVACILLGILGLGLFQILARNLWSGGVFWIDELLQQAVLWLLFLGASLATRERRHLHIEGFSRLLPGVWQPYITMVIHTTALVICALLCQAAWRFVSLERQAGTMLAFGVPTWAVQSIMPLTFLTMTLRFAGHLLHTVNLQRQQRDS